MAAYGYSGNSFDRWVGEQSSHGADNAVNKMQHQFWVAKQTILRRLGKKEDDCVVASDAELDAKLELFLSIQETCSQLHKIVEQYQERLQVLAQEENSFGHFLRNHGELDKTRAGNMMNAVGKAMIYSAQQRTSLRAPLARLHQEVETFCQRAVEDTSFTVNEMEKCRNDYRGALLWMKNVSQELDPDTFKQLEKFRRVQGHVRTSKSKFDRHKLACLQKIDLLAASRCNMFSHGLIVYQDNMAAFWKKTSDALQAVSQAYKGNQPYEFTYVKSLSESSLKLTDKSSPEAKLEFFFETDYLDDPNKKDDANESSGRNESVKSRSRTKSKAKKPESCENEPLLSLSSADDLLVSGDMNRTDESDTLLLELASLDLGLNPKPSHQNTIVDGSKGVSSSENFATLGEIFGEASAQMDNQWSQFLPSQILGNEQEDHSNFWSSFGDADNYQASGLAKTSSVRNNIPATPAPKKGSGKDMSTWYNLFADLDPLSNPDSISSTQTDDDRNC